MQVCSRLSKYKPRKNKAKVGALTLRLNIHKVKSGEATMNLTGLSATTSFNTLEWWAMSIEVIAYKIMFSQQ